MTPTVPADGVAPPRVIPERPRRAQVAEVRNAETLEWRVGVGRAIQRAIALNGWSLKEFAGAVGRDARQCARWIEGTERPQLDTIFAVPALRRSLVIALAELAGEGVEVVTAIRVTRKVA